MYVYVTARTDEWRGILIQTQFRGCVSELTVINYTGNTSSEPE